MNAFRVGAWLATTFLAVTACATAGAGSPPAVAEGCAASSGAQVLPLVELYTSEGCSSCPPADRWLGEQVARAPTAASYLAFHVDYWDDLGWPDRFASAAHSVRQRARVRAAGDNRVYTPQVMVGSDVNARWSDRAAWQSRLASHGKPAPIALAVSTQSAATWHVAVAPVGDRAFPDLARVWLAHYQDGQVTQVRSGENRGRRLRHDRVVTRLDGPWALGKASAPRAWHAARDPEAGGVVAFVQTADGEVLQSVTLDAGDCAHSWRAVGDAGSSRPGNAGAAASRSGSPMASASGDPVHLPAGAGTSGR